MSDVPVSICIPTYNGTRFLDECLASARSQTFADIEILVVDDRSSDDTVSVVRRHADQDPRIRLEENCVRLGLAENWNRCVGLARGEWIKFVFQDDLIDPLCVERLVEASVRSQGVIVAAARLIDTRGVDEETRRIYDKYEREESLIGVFGRRTKVTAAEFCDAVLDHMKHNFVGEPTAILLHRTAFDRFGGFNPALVSMCDLEFWVRVAIHTGLVIVPEPLATFRVHEDAASAANRRDRRYRLKSLDPVILLHEFAFNETFAPLRAAAAGRRSPLALEKLFADHAVAARRLAKRRAARGEGDDWFTEWRGLAEQFPRVEKAFVVRGARLRRSIRTALGLVGGMTKPTYEATSRIFGRLRRESRGPSAIGPRDDRGFTGTPGRMGNDRS